MGCPSSHTAMSNAQTGACSGVALDKTQWDDNPARRKQRKQEHMNVA